jgi:hypothetical protein
VFNTHTCRKDALCTSPLCMCVESISLAADVLLTYTSRKHTQPAKRTFDRLCQPLYGMHVKTHAYTNRDTIWATTPAPTRTQTAVVCVANVCSTHQRNPKRWCTTHTPAHAQQHAPQGTGSNNYQHTHNTPHTRERNMSRHNTQASPSLCAPF